MYTRNAQLVRPWCMSVRRYRGALPRPEASPVRESCGQVVGSLVRPHFFRQMKAVRGAHHRLPAHLRTNVEGLTSTSIVTCRSPERQPLGYGIRPTIPFSNSFFFSRTSRDTNYTLSSVIIGVPATLETSRARCRLAVLE